MLTGFNCVVNGVMCSQCISIYLVIFRNRNDYSLSRLYGRKQHANTVCVDARNCEDR